MSAYYNEIDPFAAQWLRNLIAAGHIAPGDVDERDIRLVRPEDLRGYTQCHFFAGIGVWSYALRRAGWEDTREVWTGSCPCQPFSAAGRQEGFDDERHLWPAWAALIRECRPRTVFGEQVSSKVGLAWLDLVHADLEAEGYTVGAVDTCAAGVGAPHIRQRFFFVGSLAHAGRAERSGRDGDEEGGIWGARDEPAPYGAESGMADASGERRAGERLLLRPEEGGRLEGNLLEAAGRGEAGELADTADADRRSGERRAQAGAREDGERRRGSAGDRTAGELVYTELEGLERHSGHVGDGDEPGRLGAHEAGPATAAGGAGGRLQPAECERTDRPQPVNGFWRDALWIPCRDGKARPVEPGTFPLAHGAPARVGRLRAYGNAINAEVAQEFIRAYMSL